MSGDIRQNGRGIIVALPRRFSHRPTVAVRLRRREVAPVDGVHHANQSAPAPCHSLQPQRITHLNAAAAATKRSAPAQCPLRHKRLAAAQTSVRCFDSVRQLRLYPPVRRSASLEANKRIRFRHPVPVRTFQRRPSLSANRRPARTLPVTVTAAIRGSLII